MLFALSLVFTQELASCRIHQQVQASPSPTIADRYANLRPNFVQIAQCRVTASAESRRWLKILRAAALGRQCYFDAYESSHSA